MRGAPGPVHEQDEHVLEAWLATFPAMRAIGLLEGGDGLIERFSVSAR